MGSEQESKAITSSDINHLRKDLQSVMRLLLTVGKEEGEV